MFREAVISFGRPGIGETPIFDEGSIRGMGVYGTTAPEYTCVSLRERTSAHFVRLRTPDLRLTFVLD
jgi:hypothetical protein